jgi:hypothetical protein
MSHPCYSGRHVWTDKANAEKCCHPEWQRILLVGPDAVVGASP